MSDRRLPERPAARDLCVLRQFYEGGSATADPNFWVPVCEVFPSVYQEAWEDCFRSVETVLQKNSRPLDSASPTLDLLMASLHLVLCQKAVGLLSGQQNVRGLLQRAARGVALRWGRVASPRELDELMETTVVAMLERPVDSLHALVYIVRRGEDRSDSPDEHKQYASLGPRTRVLSAIESHDFKGVSDAGQAEFRLTFGVVTAYPCGWLYRFEEPRTVTPLEGFVRGTDKVITDQDRVAFKPNTPTQRWVYVLIVGDPNNPGHDAAQSLHSFLDDRVIEQVLRAAHEPGADAQVHEIIQTALQTETGGAWTGTHDQIVLVR